MALPGFRDFGQILLKFTILLHLNKRILWIKNFNLSFHFYISYKQFIYKLVTEQLVLNIYLDCTDT